MAQEKEIQILIIGAGAVGAFYASRLALAPNVSVSVTCRSSYRHVKEHGFSITSPTHGTYTFNPMHVFPNSTEARKSNITWDYIVVSTKALPDIGDDSELLDGLISKDTAIVLIQNGIGVEEPYVRRFPGAVVLSAVTIISAAQIEPGVVRHHRWTRINSGPYLPSSTGDSSSKSASTTDQVAIARNEHFISLLQAGGIKDASAYSHAKLQLLRWHKLLINATFNPAAVLSGGSTNSDMAHDEELGRWLQDAMADIKSVAETLYGAFPKEFATAEAIIGSTKRNKSGSKPSMLLDWEDGKPMELEVILGNPIRVARKHGLEMPRVQTLYALLKRAQMNRDARKDASKGREGAKL